MLRAAPKNFLGGYSAPGVDAAGHDPAGRGLRQVVGAGEPRDAVEQDHDVLAQLDEPLGALDRELGDLGVLLARPVERRGDDLALHAAAHVGDLFGPLLDEQHHEVHLGVVLLDRVRDALQDRGLARLRRRDDQAALPLADRAQQVDDARGHVLLLAHRLEPQPLVGEQRRQVLEAPPRLRLFGVEPRDRVDAQQGGVLLVARRGPARALDRVALAQREPLRLADRDVDVPASRAGSPGCARSRSPRRGGRAGLGPRRARRSRPAPGRPGGRRGRRRARGPGRGGGGCSCGWRGRRAAPAPWGLGPRVAVSTPPSDEKGSVDDGGDRRGARAARADRHELARASSCEPSPFDAVAVRARRGGRRRRAARSTRRQRRRGSRRSASPCSPSRSS